MDDSEVAETTLEQRIDRINGQIRNLEEKMGGINSSLAELRFRRDSMTAELRRRRGE